MLRRIINVLTVVILAIFIALGIHLWQEKHFWPFSTATNTDAFLGTSFGMSIPEARRSLKNKGAHLVDYRTYKNIEESPLIEDLDFQPLFYEEIGKDISLYMPSIEMFNSEVEAELNFYEGRLSYIRVHFLPISKSNNNQLITLIDSTLKKQYEFAGREESKEVKGAYNLKYTKPQVDASLWVNSQRQDEPIIILSLLYLPLKAQRAKKIKEREERAFSS